MRRHLLTDGHFCPRNPDQSSPAQRAALLAFPQGVLGFRVVIIADTISMATIWATGGALEGLL